VIINSYQSKNVDIFVFIRDLLQTITEDYVYSKAYSLGEGVKEIIKDPKIWENGSIPSEDTIQTMINEVVKSGAAKTRNYKKWILGYGLVLLCAIFDDFLNDLLEEILTKNIEFTRWNNKQEIMDKFKEGTIKYKYKVFVNKLGFSESEFFDFKMFIPRIQLKHAGVNLAKLIDIYKKRNHAAHSDSYVIYTIEELEEIKDLFEKLIWNLSRKSKDKWNVEFKLV